MKGIASVVLFLTVAAQASTWHIRPDGGQPVDAFGSVQTNYCDGQSDAPASGHSTTDHACALGDYRWLYATRQYNTHRWLVAGGDTVILHDASGATPLRVSGYNGPNSTDYWGDAPGAPSSEGAQPIPSGTSGAHTRILGENYANCTTKTKVFAGYGANAVFRLIGSQYVDIQCIDMTDHAQCGRMGTSNGCSGNYPMDDFALQGLTTSTSTANIRLIDVDIHGFASRGIIGPIGGDIYTQNLRIAFNTGAGWDLDDGTTHTPSTGGTITLQNDIFEWNGCTEEYPIVDSIPAYLCWDQSSAGYGDAIGTADGDGASFYISQSIFRYNTQDGPDLLHSNNGSFVIDRSQSYGNQGQQLKLGATSNSQVTNSLFVHNCGRIQAGNTFPGTASGFNANLGNWCRPAGADVFAFGWGDSSTTFKFNHNTVIAMGGTLFDITCTYPLTGGQDCTTGTKNMQDNIFIAYGVTGYNANQLPGAFCYTDCNNTGLVQPQNCGGVGCKSSTDTQWTTRSNNKFYNFRSSNNGCTSHPSETCTTDPVITGEPSSPFANWQAFDYSLFNFKLPAGSPSIGAGVAITGITADYNGYSWATPPSIGALEFNSGVPAAPVAPAPFLLF